MRITIKDAELSAAQFEDFVQTITVSALAIDTNCEIHVDNVTIKVKRPGLIPKEEEDPLDDVFNPIGEDVVSYAKMNESFTETLKIN